MLTYSLFGENLSEVFKVGEKASNMIYSTLFDKQKERLDGSTIEETFEFCIINAMYLTLQADEKLGDKLSIARISEKFRNPVNKPTKAEMKILHMLEYGETSLLTKVSKLKNTYKFYQPLYVFAPRCLKCHGGKDDIPETVQESLDVYYPADRAVGYKIGDFRGAIVITITRDGK